MNQDSSVSDIDTYVYFIYKFGRLRDLCMMHSTLIDYLSQSIKHQHIKYTLLCAVYLEDIILGQCTLFHMTYDFTA